MADLMKRESWYPEAVDPFARFDRLFNEWSQLMPFRRPMNVAHMVPDQMIRVDEFREDDTLVIRADLPGIDPDKDVDVSVHDGLLHIKGRRMEREEETKKTYYRSEFRYGMFERTVALPAGATEKDVLATYKDGLLEVRVPMRTEETEAAKVPVQRVE